ncbi:Non-histone chromosomal protein 6 [Rhizophlyctis rosea]|uniref:Non-histone chromosomal protein 6 n=1 Tax=Rhizophlyctis rosea TaxID=64517 RepID=A0AAD5X1X1_9FUNG|nr:Non-histone chromosomal protein 6 [Rhizophlyctis rosea]
MPKRPLSAFLIFANENRARLEEENPDADSHDMSKVLAQAFQNLPASERTVYDQKAQADKKRYAAELEVYNKWEGNNPFM